MTIPIIGEPHNPYIIVEMVPSMAPGAVTNTFDVQINTQHFGGGSPLAVQCLLQAVVFMLPHAFAAVAEVAIQQLLNQQRAQNNGERL